MHRGDKERKLYRRHVKEAATDLMELIAFTRNVVGQNTLLDQLAEKWQHLAATPEEEKK